MHWMHFHECKRIAQENLTVQAILDIVDKRQCKSLINKALPKYCQIQLCRTLVAILPVGVFYVS